MFIGREKELKILKERLSSRSASLIALRGRRRIGKSRLIEEFSKNFTNKFLFTGLPPTKGVTSRMQKKEFAKQMASHGLPNVNSDDWSDLFWVLGNAALSQPVLIALDEVAWMGSKDPSFLSKLKVAWDRFFEKNPRLILIVSSSISSWIDKNILNSTGFFGRVDLTITLKELSLKDCCKFWGKEQKKVSNYDKLKVLGVTGGVPKYLDAIRQKLSAEENIQALCFSESGLLFNEFDRIFHDLFHRRSKIYKDIVELLSNCQSLSQSEICEGIKRENGRVISEYLYDLVTAGFLASNFTWSIKASEMSKLRKYRVRDNYLRVYLKYIAPNKQKIRKGYFDNKSLFSTLKWESIMGFQFENLVIHNFEYIYKKLGIHTPDIIFDGPFFQTKTKRQKGCQIDYLVQTKSHVLYICEIKFSKRPIGLSVVEEVQEKIKNLYMPKYFSYRPILIHVGGVTRELIEKDYFYEIIDWLDFLE